MIMNHIYISGDFTDKNNACKFCKNFKLWGTCYGYCCENEEDIHCNETCDKFDKDTDTFDENNNFVSEDAKIMYYS